jgi:hypothetical protein
VTTEPARKRRRFVQIEIERLVGGPHILGGEEGKGGTLMVDLLSSGKTEPQTRHDLSDTYSRRAADADATVDERCGVV